MRISGEDAATDRREVAQQEGAQQMAADKSEDTTPARKLDATLMKGFAILDALASAETPLGVSALSEMLGFGKSNVHRLLYTLSSLGYVQQEAATRHYSPTMKAWELGTQVARRNPLLRAGNSVMQVLHEKTGETVYMSMLSGSDILYLQILSSSRSATSPALVGLRWPAVMTASGKVLLAFQENIPAVVAEAAMKLPPGAPLDVDATIREFEEIQQRRYALSDSGWIRGVNAIAVAIPNRRRPPVASIGISTLPDRSDLPQLAKFAPQLLNAATQIATNLGMDLTAGGY